ncbi:hypothetical protein J6590_076438 [Homalodisca vitripennis]|nr:hypothetical protein J6590_076438 [Homalodisca vitripennis]
MQSNRQNSGELQKRPETTRGVCRVSGSERKLHAMGKKRCQRRAKRSQWGNQVQRHQHQQSSAEARPGKSCVTVESLIVSVPCTAAVAGQDRDRSIPASAALADHTKAGRLFRTCLPLIAGSHRNMWPINKRTSGRRDVILGLQEDLQEAPKRKIVTN